jgi:hypothetical protein
MSRCVLAPVWACFILFFCLPVSGQVPIGDVSTHLKRADNVDTLGQSFIRSMAI